MDHDNSSDIVGMRSLLDQLDALAPHRPRSSRRVVFRPVSPDWVIDDSLTAEEASPPNDETPDTGGDNNGQKPVQPTGPSSSSSATDTYGLDDQTPPCARFLLNTACTVTAVDCGMIMLGQTEDGLILALRAAMVSDSGGHSQMQLFRTGPIYLRNNAKVAVLQAIGEQFGNRDFYVRERKNSSGVTPEFEIKAGVASDEHSFADRLRNWLERRIQSLAARTTSGGILLIDGALTLRTRDTPGPYLSQLVQTAHQQDSSVVAISKQSELLVMNRSVRFWLKDCERQACYRRLTPLMRREGAARVIGNTYAARFSPLGNTLRVDTAPRIGETDDEAFGRLYASTLMRGGYPDILVRAHIHSFFPASHVSQLRAQASVMYNLTPQPDVSFGASFGAFAGRFKK